MRLALLFSGQGHQHPDHLNQLKSMAAESLQPILVKSLGHVLTDPISTVDLSVNLVAQPFIFGYEITWWHALQPQLPTPICAAGYSLGEMAACCAAGLFSDTDGVQLCRERARLMDNAASVNVKTSTSMLAVSGLPENVVDQVVTKHRLAIAIRNSPQHFVVTGAKQSVLQAIADFKLSGASALTPVAVQTPAHTHFLEPASTAFANSLAGHLARANDNLLFPVISAINGKMSTTKTAAADALAKQISSTLHWDEAMQTLTEMRPDVVLEIGPGNALSKMLSEAGLGLPVRSVSEFKTPLGVADWLRRYA